MSAPTPGQPAQPGQTVKAADPFHDAKGEKGFLEAIREYILIPFDKTVLRAVPEIGHLAPVILTFGTLFMSVVSLNYPLMVFCLSSIEAFLLYNTIRGVSDLTTDISSLKGKTETPEQKKACHSFFQGTGPSRFKYFMSSGLVNEFPNSPLYFISFAAAYCIQSMYFFSQESSELGPQYSNRPYLGILGAGMFIALYAIYLAAYGCDSIFNLILTIVIGIIVGFLICYQNFLLLGKGGVGLLFIPPIARRAGMDYICVTTNTPTNT
jgi:hypothetical protein